MKKLKYLLLLIAQAVIALAAAFAASRAMLLGGFAAAVGMWAVVPILGCISAYFITVKGVSNYLAWILPPISMMAGHYLAFFYLPKEPGPVLLCVFLAVVGAATGDVVKKNRGK